MKSNPNSNETPCKLRPGFVCSPSQGPCCTHDTCRLKVGNKCRDDNGCRTASYCSGQTPQCPPSVNKPNKTICNEESVCYMGECTGSICIAFGKSNGANLLKLSSRLIRTNLVQDWNLVSASERRARTTRETWIRSANSAADCRATIRAANLRSR